MIKTKNCSNDFKVNILHNQSDIIKFSLNVGAGFKYENEENNGIAHYLEHVLITKETKAIYPYLIDFTTTFNSINLFFQCKKENLNELFNNLFDLFTYKKFNKEHIKFIKEEKTIIQNDINLYQDSINLNGYWIFMNKKLFPNSSKGLNYLGSIENIKKINQKELIEWKNKFFLPNNASLNIIGNIDFKFIENILKNNFLSIKKNNLDVNLKNVKSSCKSVIKKNLNGKYFYYAFDLNNSSQETKLVGLLLMNEISNQIREKIRNQKRDGYFNFGDINWDLGYIYFHVGSFKMANSSLIESLKELLRAESFNIDTNKFELIKNNLKSYFDNLPENLVLVNMGNVSFGENSLSIFNLKSDLENFSYKQFKKNLKNFFKLKQDYIIIE